MYGSKFIWPRLNPIAINRVGGIPDLSYRWELGTKLDDSFYNYLYHARIPVHEQKVWFQQKVVIGDRMDIIFALVSGIDPFIGIYKCNGDAYFCDVVDGDSRTPFWTWTDDYGVTWNYYRYQIDTTIWPANIYYFALFFHLNTSVDAFFLSEPLNVKASHTNTLELSWSHSGVKYGIPFDQLNADFRFRVRVDGGWESEGWQPKSNDVIYNDMLANPLQLSSVPYSTRRVTFGGSLGIPNWQAEILNYIIACDKLYVDGVQYCKVSGAKMEPTREKFYPLAGWRVELAESDLNWEMEYLPTMRIVGYGNAGLRGSSLILG